MTTPPSPTPPPAAASASTAPDAPAATAPPRLPFLFRHSLRAGQLHPLLHLIERHRAETGATT